MQNRTAQSSRLRSRGFTLIELLTVVAIIALLIGILVPSLSKARDSAKNVKTKATMKGAGDSLELFRTENDRELRGADYPPSKAGDDPTESGDNYQNGNEDLFGAQWLVRFLMGKNLDGYVSRQMVPRVFFQPPFGPPQAGWEQKGWYLKPGDPNFPTGLTKPLDRNGPYLPPGTVVVKAPRDLRGGDPTSTLPKHLNPVIVDTFEMPILYYAANTLHGSRANANIATYDGTSYPGVFTYLDNALFTGLCTEAGCNTLYPVWDFGNGEHPLVWGPQSWVGDPETMRNEIGTRTESFPYYIMNRDAFDSTDGKAVIPNRKDSFLLISPGKDGLFGTNDDVKNF